MFDGVSVQANEENNGDNAAAAIHAKPQENLGLRAHESGRDEVRELRPPGFEPGTLGLGNIGFNTKTLDSYGVLG